MLLHAFVPASRANGPGLRAVVYFQGCSLNCSGCWNQSSHKFRGEDVTTTTVLEVAQRFEKASRLAALEGVTFSGGEPMQQVEALAALMGEIRKVAPAASLGMFTGYTKSELATGQYVTRPPASLEGKRKLWQVVLGFLDFAVMGRYDQAQPAAEPLRTSRNQRLELFSSRYIEADFGPQLVEIGIDQTGKTVLTGFPILGFPA